MEKRNRKKLIYLLEPWKSIFTEWKDTNVKSFKKLKKNAETDDCKIALKYGGKPLLQGCCQYLRDLPHWATLSNNSLTYIFRHKSSKKRSE